MAEPVRVVEPVVSRPPTVRPATRPPAARPLFDAPLQRARETAADAVARDPNEIRIGAWSPVARGLPIPAALTTRKPLLVAGGATAAVLVLAILFFAIVRASRPPVVAAVGPDLSSLEQALATGERSSLRGWLRDFPESPHRERAYLALTKVGMTVAEVCRHARDNSPDVLVAGGELATTCRGK